jgi:Cell surface protein
MKSLKKTTAILLTVFLALSMSMFSIISAADAALSDGVYSVTATILKADEDVASMTNTALKGATLYVEDGKYTVVLSMGPMGMGGTYVSGFTYKNDAGEMVSAEVVSQDADGNALEFRYTVYNNDNPCTVKFSMAEARIQLDLAAAVLISAPAVEEVVEEAVEETAEIAEEVIAEEVAEVVAEVAETEAPLVVDVEPILVAAEYVPAQEHAPQTADAALIAVVSLVALAAYAALLGTRKNRI